MRAEPRFLPSLSLLVSGFLAWAAHFGLIYGYAGLMCARPHWASLQIGGWGLVPLGIAAITALTLLALAGVMAGSGMLRGRAEGSDEVFEERFYRYLTQGSALLGGVAIIWQGALSIALVPSCG
jgi:hypothetical protein